MFVKNKGINIIIVFLIILGTPILFIGILKLYYLWIPGEEVGKVGDWISFSGGYIGALLALGGIWKQIESDKKEKEKEKKEGILKYFKYILELNLNTLLHDQNRKNLYLLSPSLPNKQFGLSNNITIFSDEIINSNIDKVFILDNFDNILKIKMQMETYKQTLYILNENIHKTNKNFRDLNLFVATIDSNINYSSSEKNIIKLLNRFISALGILIQNYISGRTATPLLALKNRIVLLVNSNTELSSNLNEPFKKFLNNENFEIIYNYDTLRLMLSTLYESTEMLYFCSADDTEIFNSIMEFSTQEKYLLDTTENLKLEIESLISKINDELKIINI